MTVPNLASGAIITEAWVDAVATDVTALQDEKQAPIVTTSQNTTSTSYTDLSTVGPAITVTTGNWVRLSIFTTGNAAHASDSAIATVAVSGATTIATGTMVSTWGLQNQHAGTGSTNVSDWVYVKVTPGSNTFTMKYAGLDAGGGGVTATFSNRILMVETIDL